MYTPDAIIPVIYSSPHWLCNTTKLFFDGEVIFILTFGLYKIHTILTEEADESEFIGKTWARVQRWI